MSGIGGSEWLETRGKSIGLLMARKKVKEVAYMLGFSMKTIWYWWKIEKKGDVAIGIS